MDATLTVRNDTDRPLMLDLGTIRWEIPPGSSEDFARAEIQVLLELGVHHLSDELPAIWVVDRAESPFGDITEITTQGFGPLRTNMTVEESARLLGVRLVDLYPALGHDLADCTFVAPVGPPDPYAPQLQVFFGRDLGTGRIVRIETADPAIATPEGIQVGHTEKELIAAYGDRLVRTPSNGYLRYTLAPVDPLESESILTFSITLGPTAADQTPTIASIWTSTSEAADLTEGCS